MTKGNERILFNMCETSFFIFICLYIRICQKTDRKRCIH